MILYRQIMIVVLGIMLVNCGNNNSDGRIVLSSESGEDQLVIPDGACEDCVVSKSKIENEIARRIGSFKTVSDLSFYKTFTQYLAPLSDFFTASFTAQTNSGKTYTIQCAAASVDTTYSSSLYLEKCLNDEVRLKGFLVITL